MELVRASLGIFIHICLHHTLHKSMSANTQTDHFHTPSFAWLLYKSSVTLLQVSHVRCTEDVTLCKMRWWELEESDEWSCCGDASVRCTSFLFFFPFLDFFLFFSLPSAFCHSFGSCWRQITGTGGLYLLYWALDSQVCVQCWWMFLMSRAQCECERSVSIQEFVYVVTCVGCFKLICMECRKLRGEENKDIWEHVSVCYT